jgi:DTW domain-containing protein YfiP
VKTVGPTGLAGLLKRAICTRCLRPQITCICQWVTPVVHAVEVLILQHPLEVAHAKGSTRLLHLSLSHSRLVTGEVFDVQACVAGMDAQECSKAGSREAQKPSVPKYNILLYPSPEAGQSHGTPWPPLFASDCLQVPSQLRLIVLDGTWRKSRKMLYRNPSLQQLPRLSLQGARVSQYLIRKAHRPGQLSTLEATCAALAQLEGDPGKFAPLLKAFDGFVAQQSGYRRATGLQAG